MVISINPLCSCNEIPQFAALQPPKVHTQRLQKALSLSFLYFGYLFFISCFFMSHFNPPKVHIKRLHKKLSLSFFWRRGICVLFHVFLCRISTFPKYTFKGCTKNFHFLYLFWIGLFMLMFMFIDVALYTITF